MHNTQVHTLLWEAYKQGVLSTTILGSYTEFDDQDQENDRKAFEKWLEDNYPDFVLRPIKAGDRYIWHNNGQLCIAQEAELEQLNKHLKTGGISHVSTFDYSRGVYWHEFGCRASTDTPNGVGMGTCTCAGQHPDGTYDHDVVCNARPTTPIGGPMCSCKARRINVSL